MKYQAGQRRKAIEYEKAITKWWEKNKTFQKSVEQRPIDKSYVFYDGPPFITGNPHHGTLLSSIVKDAVPRYWTMNGYRVERRWGWDCHGLPAENFVEKQLGITDRRDIGTKWTLEDYIVKARESMVANSETWRSTIDRVGRWVDFDNAYRTMNKDFMESVWWAFKELYDAGKIYEGRKVLMYDTKFATPVSKAEVTMDNDAYQTVTDPSAYVKFKLIDKDIIIEGLPSKSPIYLLAWTTTPWTLMANRALAVNPDMDYVLVKAKGDTYIVAKSRLESVFTDEDYELVGAKSEINTDDKPKNDSQKASRSKNPKKVNTPAESAQSAVEPSATIKGNHLAGLKYESIDGTTCQVFTADFVGSEEGTGIVHIAPAYGEDDYELYKQHEGEIDFVDTLDENGYYIEEYADKLHKLGVRDTDEYGIQIWSANKFIAKCLQVQGIIYRIDYIQHEYPFNPRSKERIMYRAFPSWFFDINGQKQMMLEENEHINWFPSYLKHGRFANNIEAAPDWNLSRDRFWATAMPVWKGEKTGAIKVFGSYEELKEFSGKELEDYHRPWVDEIEFDAYVTDGNGKSKDVFSKSSVTNEEQVSEVPPVTTAVGAEQTENLLSVSRRRPAGDFESTGEHERVEKKLSSTSVNGTLDHFTRIDKVLDCWFESGSMPFAQLHYPFENKDKFELGYPADFIVEYVGQVRAWFYYVHAVNTALAGIGAFGKKAKKGHKNAYKNVITTGTLAGNDGRKMSKSLGNYTDPNELMDQYSADSLRFLLLSSPVLSGEDFALLDKDVSDVNRKLNMLWNVYDFFTTYAEIEGIDSDDFDSATPITSPLDQWIIERFNELRDEITNGMEAYDIPRALSGVLLFIDDLSNWFVRRSRRRFSKNNDPNDQQAAFYTLHTVLINTSIVLAPFVPFLAEELYQKLTGSDQSVHLLDWPTPIKITKNTVLIDMARTRQIITDALALRMQKSDTEDQIKIRQPLSKLTYNGDKLDNFYEQIIADEVNVKKVEKGSNLKLDKTLTPELKEEGRAREIIRAVQSARKHAGLRQDDQIKLSIFTEIPKGFEEIIKSEVGAAKLTHGDNYAHDEIAKINGENVTISLEKL